VLLSGESLHRQTCPSHNLWWSSNAGEEVIVRKEGGFCARLLVYSNNEVLDKNHGKNKKNKG